MEDAYCIVESFVFDSRTEAETILVSVSDIIRAFGFMTIKKYYELCGSSIEPKFSNDYGWDNLNGVVIDRLCDSKYTIRMPYAVKKN